MLLALSAGAFAHDWRLAGVTAGLLALLFRELALPGAVAGLALAWQEKRRREVVRWLAALAVFGLYLLLHAWQVSLRNTGAEISPLGRWLALGGLRFVLETSRVHGLLAQFPMWVAAVCVPLAWLGLAGWPGPTGARVGLTVALFVGAFALVGREFNQYWGAVYSPLLTFGFVWCIPALRDLVRLAFRARERETQAAGESPR